LLRLGNLLNTGRQPCLGIKTAAQTVSDAAESIQPFRLRRTSVLGLAIRRETTKK
jgi:hypothetical protein